MTYARAHLVDAENGGLYHCISRCVRRAWLCGNDPVSGRSFEHRRQWLESRLLALAEVFAVDLYAYAVMSNHYHAVLELVPGRARGWSDEEVARRWCALGRRRDREETEARVAALLGDAERLAVVREQLGSLSWYMRYVNEPMARRANREDEVTGRFWEGRFTSIALLDEPAVLECMAYVDLNPVRAGLAERAGAGAHTSIRRRLGDGEQTGAPLADLGRLGLTLRGYHAVLEWSASVERGGVLPPAPEAAEVLSRLGLRPEVWLARVKVHRLRYRAYGALRLLREYTEKLGQHWLRGARPGLAAPA